MAALTSLTSKVTDAESRARFLAAQSAHAGDWLHAPPITAVCLRLSNEAIRVAVGMRLGINLCEPHVALLLTKEDYTAYLAVEVLADNSVIVY